MQTANLKPPPSTPEPATVRALLQRGHYAAALQAATDLLAAKPEDRDGLYMLAVAQRYLQRLPDALATLKRLEANYPNFPRLFQERGHCYVAQRAAAPAIEAFETATVMSPALPASWRALEGLYRITNQPEKVAKAAAQVENLAKLPPEVVAAFGMFADDDITEAEQVLRQYLLKHGAHVEAMRLLAQIGMRMDVNDDAEILLASALELAPAYDDLRYDYALVLLKRHKHVLARVEIEKLLKKFPDNLDYRTTYATICTRLGDYQTAMPVYEQVLQEAPGSPELHLSIAHALKTIGRTPEAIESYRTAAAGRPRFGDAYWSLANLKTYRFSDAEIARMRADEATPRIAIEDRFHLCFALGKALEDRGEYAESFKFYERGNALKKQECRYRPEPFENSARLQAQLCTREFFAARQGFGCDSRAPIFIVGLPRAGSTLLEQILASHSQVEGTMELADILRFVQGLQGREHQDSTPRYPAVLADLSAADFRKFGEQYLDDTRVYRTGKPMFIDKMPNNFRHIGLMHLMLPNAKIIDARREPLACCFSNFKQLFASGQQFTYSIEDISRYYRMYVDLMAHWDDALPGRILRVQHEDVVADLAGSVRRILAFCELDFEPGCVEFYKTERRVHTASSEQVRRPINRDGVDQWRNFDPWLGPLKEALGPLLDGPA